MEVRGRQFASKIAVLEDERSWGKDISDRLAFSGSVKILKNYKDFHDALRKEKFDAVSVDWYVDEREKGREALRFVEREQPEAVRIVFTHDQSRLDEARLYAEGVLLKGNMQEYVDLMQEARRLGRARWIVKELTGMGLNHTVPPKLPFPLPKPEENQVREVSRAALRSVLMRGGAHDHLRYLLVGRGWWQSLKINDYTGLSKFEKLLRLASYVNLDETTIAAITGIEPDQLKNRLSGSSWNTGQQEIRDADHLLSLLGYALRVSGYEPELMSHFWLSEKLFLDSLQPAPWDRYGMGRFLTMGRSESLAAAVEWIRSH